jgi:protein-L-isoaspartate(D-aspartate) O-methyltransferase
LGGERAVRQDYRHLRHRPHPSAVAAAAPDGIMVIPVGPPGAQHVLKAVKRTSPDGQMSVARSDIYGGAIIPFVPFTGSHQS